MHFFLLSAHNNFFGRNSHADYSDDSGSDFRLGILSSWRIGKVMLALSRRDTIRFFPRYLLSICVIFESFIHFMRSTFVWSLENVQQSNAKSAVWCSYGNIIQISKIFSFFFFINVWTFVFRRNRKNHDRFCRPIVSTFRNKSSYYCVCFHAIYSVVTNDAIFKFIKICLKSFFVLQRFIVAYRYQLNYLFFSKIQTRDGG